MNGKSRKEASSGMIWRIIVIFGGGLAALCSVHSKPRLR